ncbi:MAG: hypothetical protein ACYDCQ_19215, partial [Dehalococcoidia bacterium]
SVQAGRWQLGALWRMLRVNLPQEGSLLLLGVLGALIAGPAPVAIAVPLLATIIVHRELALLANGPLVELVRPDDELATNAGAMLRPYAATYWFGAG